MASSSLWCTPSASHRFQWKHPIHRLLTSTPLKIRTFDSFHSMLWCRSATISPLVTTSSNNLHTSAIPEESNTHQQVDTHHPAVDSQPPIMQEQHEHHPSQAESQPPQTQTDPHTSNDRHRQDHHQESAPAVPHNQDRQMVLDLNTALMPTPTGSKTFVLFEAGAEWNDLKAKYSSMETTDQEGNTTVVPEAELEYYRNLFEQYKVAENHTF